MCLLCIFVQRERCFCGNFSAVAEDFLIIRSVVFRKVDAFLTLFFWFLCTPGRRGRGGCVLEASLCVVVA